MSSSRDYKARYGDWGLVVGASEGLGEALARDLARRGMNVAMVARGEAKLREAAVRLAEDFGVEARPIVADLADPNILAVLERGMAGAEVSFLIYNCAGENGGQFLKQDVERHLFNILINCTAPTILVHHYGRRMVERGRGGIVLCSSLAAVRGLYSWVTYGASKAYEMILGEGLWYELGRHGVGATAFMIGQTYTPTFQKSQAARNAMFARSRVPEDLPPGVQPPQEPADASANLFAQIDKEWLPLIYANPLDEAAAEVGKATPIAEQIVRASDAMRGSFTRAEPQAS
jgi:short-subunit dehydrogenase